MARLGEWAVFTAGAFVAVLAVEYCTGCQGAQARAAAAEGAYLAEKVRCVDANRRRHPTPEAMSAAIDACYAAVEERWGVRDGGSHGR